MRTAAASRNTAGAGMNSLPLMRLHASAAAAAPETTSTIAPNSRHRSLRLLRHAP